MLSAGFCVCLRDLTTYTCAGACDYHGPAFGGVARVAGRYGGVGIFVPFGG